MNPERKSMRLRQLLTIRNLLHQGETLEDLFFARSDSNVYLRMNGESCRINREGDVEQDRGYVVVGSYNLHANLAEQREF